VESLLPVGLIITGFVLGAFVFSRVGYWLVGVHAAVRRNRIAGSRLSAAALLPAVLLASGPWVLLAVGVLAFNTIGQVWAQWLFGGMGAAIAGFGVLSIYMARKAHASKGKHAA
jgi:hypothetical protein